MEKISALPAQHRLREEDPFTDRWTEAARNRIIVHRSRFEVDLNRPRESAVYLQPGDAWGLSLWKSALPRQEIETSLAYYDAFYEFAFHYLKRIERDFGKFVVLDLHTYNHRRDGPDAEAADPQANPEVNIGTGTLENREQWAPVVDSFMEALRSFDFNGRSLDVRENVKFKGGEFSRWVHRNFPRTGLSLAVEFKKTFMDEWTGRGNVAEIVRIGNALRAAVPALLERIA